jgi:putative membrane protein
MNFLIKWAVNIIALFLVVHMIAGVSTDSWQTTVIAALVVGMLNAFLRPFFIMLTLPLNILSLGLVTLFINGFMFYLAARFVAGFRVAGFWSAFWAALLFSIVSFLLNLLFTPGVSVGFKQYGRCHPDSVRLDKGDIIDVEGKKED